MPGEFISPVFVAPTQPCGRSSSCRQELSPLTQHVLYCLLNRNAPLPSELFIYFPPLSPVKDRAPLGLLRYHLRGFKYIGCICFPPLSGSDDTADKRSSLRAEQPQQQNNRPLLHNPHRSGTCWGANCSRTGFTEDSRRARQRRSTFT